MTQWLAISALLAALFAMPAQAQVTGAGSTFAQAVLMQWSNAYQRTQRDREVPAASAALDYEPIGSQGGIMRIRERGVDFGATDVPLSSPELITLGLAQFPFVIGGVVTVVSVSGVGPGQLRLTGQVLADIYQAKITDWADPAIAALNPDLSLPAAPITVVRRSDRSGTTFNFTYFLAAYSPSWRAEIGADLDVPWPIGIAARGNGGVAETVKRTENAIGYVDFAQAQRLQLSYALLRNSSGSFIRPDVASFQAAAASADWAAATDFALLLTDAPGAQAYPIVATTFALMPKRSAASARSQATLAFFRWSLDHGAAAATELGYVALPEPLVTRVKEYWATQLADGG